MALNNTGIIPVFNTEDSNANVTMDMKVMVLLVMKSTNVRKIIAMKMQSALIMLAISHVNVTLGSKVTV